MEAASTACVACGAALAADAVFCSQCGTRQAPRCTGCRAALSAEDRFCSRCGTPVAHTSPSLGVAPVEPVAERRWASVLFADLVGFTTLSESRDPEQVRELLSGYFDRCRQIITSYDGVVEKFIGDAVMAVWGVPTAHEDDAERAVRAGVDLVAMVTALGEQLHADLALRVGVVTGEVAATLGATGQGMVAGDPVNTAARVQAAAEPGRVYVDEATRSLTAAIVDYQDAGRHTLKGKAETQQLFAVKALRSEPVQEAGVEALLVGRDRELGLLRGLFESVVAEGRPRLIVVDGDAGVGKSRLIREFQGWIDSLPGTTWWHRGRCLSYGDGVAFRALSEAIRARLGLLERDTTDTAADRLDSYLSRLPIENEERAWLRPGVGLLVGASVDRSFEQGELFAAWTRFLELVGHGDPVVLVIDDAHHADDGLLDFVDFLMGASRAPIVIIAMARPELLEHRPGWGGRRAAVVPLAPLPHDDMRALIEALLDGVPQATQEVLVQRAGGIPLFAVEIVRALLDQSLATLDDGRPTLIAAALEPDQLAAPASLRSLIRTRLDALPDDQRRVVGDASVLGLTSTLDGLQALAPADLDLAAAVAGLRRREILDVDTDRFSGERGQLRFTHAVVRQVAYDTLSRRDRKTRHLAAAHHIAEETPQTGEYDAIIAQHLLDALEASFNDDPDRVALAAAASERLTKAGERALEIGAPRQGLSLLTRAIELETDPRRRAHAEVTASLCAALSGDPEQGVVLAGHALEYLEDEGTTPEVGAALAAYVRSQMWAQHFAEVLEAAQPRLDRLRRDPQADDHRLEVVENMWLAGFHLGVSDQAEALLSEMVTAGEVSDDPRRRFRALRYLAEAAWDRGDDSLAEAYFREAIDIAPDRGSYGVHSAYMYLAVLVSAYDVSEAVALAHEGVEDSRRRGVTIGTHWCLSTELELLFSAGQFARMSELLEGVDEADVAGAVRGLLAEVSALLGWVTGQPRPAWRMDESLEGYGAQVGYHAALSSDAQSRGLWAVAAHHATAELELKAGVEGRQSLLWSSAIWSSIAVSAGDTDLAERILRVVGLSELSTDSPQERAFGAFCRGRLAPLARRDDGVEHLRRAIPALMSYGAPGFTALAQLSLAEQLGPTNSEYSELRMDAVRTLEALGAFGWLPSQ